MEARGRGTPNPGVWWEGQSLGQDGGDPKRAGMSPILRPTRE